MTNLLCKYCDTTLTKHKTNTPSIFGSLYRCPGCGRIWACYSWTDTPIERISDDPFKYPNVDMVRFTED